MAKERNKGGSGARIEGRGEKIFDIAITIVGIALVILCLYPLWYVFIASVSRPLYVENGSVMFRPVFFTLESYKEAFKTPFLWTSFGNSLFYTFFGVLVNMVFSTTMAYALSRSRLLFRKGFTMLAVFTMWFSAGIIPMYMNFRDFNLLNTRTAILFGFAISTYNMIILKSFFEQVPSALEEAAFIDGASDFRIFVQIFLPLSKPALATVALFYGVKRWNGYFWPMNLLTSDSKVPLQVLLKKLLVDRTANEMESAIITSASLSNQTTVIYALILLAIIPMAVIYPFIQKYFRSGITIGAVKG